MRSLRAFTLGLAFTACAPAPARPVPPAGHPLDGKLYFAVVRQDSTEDRATLDAFRGPSGGDFAHWAYTEAKLEVWRGDELVETLDHERRLTLPAGEYRIRLVWADRRPKEVSHFVLSRDRCFDGTRAWVERAAVSADAVWHDAYLPPVVDVTRPIPRYPGFHTRIEWRQGSELVSHKVSGGEAPAPAIQDEVEEGRLAREYIDPYDPSCKTLWGDGQLSLRVPPEVLARGGRFVLRLVSPDTRAIEVDLDVPRGLHAGKPGPIDLPPDWQPARDPLQVRTVAARADELAWAREVEKSYVISIDPGRAPYAAPIPITVDVLRAIARRPELAAALVEFMSNRQMSSALTVDHAGALRAGAARGESVASIDARLAARQQELDRNEADDRAGQRAHERQLRARILAGVARYGTRPLGDDELR